jgi:hypothetical protein
LPLRLATTSKLRGGWRFWNYKVLFHEHTRAEWDEYYAEQKEVRNV